MWVWQPSSWSFKERFLFGFQEPLSIGSKVIFSASSFPSLLRWWEGWSHLLVRGFTAAADPDNCDYNNNNDNDYSNDDENYDYDINDNDTNNESKDDNDDQFYWKRQSRSRTSPKNRLTDRLHLGSTRYSLSLSLTQCHSLSLSFSLTFFLSLSLSLVFKKLIYVVKQVKNNKPFASSHNLLWAIKCPCNQVIPFVAHSCQQLGLQHLLKFYFGFK